MSPEQAIFEFLEDAARLAPTPSILHGITICPTVYHNFEKSAIRIGNCNSEFSPGSNGEIKEYEAKIPLEILSRLPSTESTAYSEARETVRSLAMEIVKLLLATPSLNQGNCDLQVEQGFRGWAKVNGADTAVVIISVTVNPFS